MRATARTLLLPVLLISACSDDTGPEGDSSDTTDTTTGDVGGTDTDTSTDSDALQTDVADAQADVQTDTSTEEDVAEPVPGSCEAATAVSGSFEIPGCGYSVSLARYQIDALPDCNAAEVDPEHVPRTVHLNFPQTDASDSVAVVWSTGYSNRHAVVEYGLDPESLESAQTGHSFTYSTLGGRTVAAEDKRLLHEVHLCGLTPATTYYYRVGGGEIWSDVYSFTTAPEIDSDGEFTFAVTGDTRSATQELWGQALDVVVGEGAEFLVFTGDAVEVGTNQEEWDVWFGRGEPSEATDRLATLPLLFANGNHDVGAEPVWANFAQEGLERYSTIRYGNAVFIVMNDDPFSMIAEGETVEEDGAAYLESALEANQDARWKFVIHHRAIYSASNHGSQEDLQEAWLPLIDSYEVDMVLNGHDHNYERSHFIRNGEVVGEGSGTVFAVVNGVGAPLYESGTDWWTAYSESVPSYAMITIDGNTLTYTAKRLDGTVIDEFTWTKD